MSKIELNTTISDFGWSQINANFQEIEDEFNNKVLYRTNPAGETNVMNNDLDMNGHHIYNLATPSELNEPARLQDVINAVSGATQANLITFNPSGTISSGTVQGAIQELDTENQATHTSLQTQITNIVSETVSNITALRALNKTIHSRAFVQGYYNVGDGGGGHYYLDSADLVSADNGGTIIVATDGGRWKLIHEGAVTIKQFGAVADGVTETSARIQAAFNSGVKTIKATDGNYLIGTTLVPPLNSFEFIGEKAAKFLANVNGLTFIKSTVSAFYVRFQSLWFHGNGKTGVVGFDMKNMRLYSGLLDIKWESMDTGFIGRDGCFGLMISNPTAEAVAFPVVFAANNSGSVIDTPQFDNGIGVGGTGLGIGVTIQGGGTNLGSIVRGGYIQGFEIGVTDSGTGTTVENVYFENCSVTDINGSGDCRQARYVNINHWGGVGPSGYKLRNTDAVTILDATMGSGARTQLFDIDGTNTNTTFKLSTSNASLGAPTGSLSNMSRFVPQSVTLFTPTIAGSSTTGSATYSVQSGRLMRMGNFFQATIDLAWTGHTGTGNMQVLGIPTAGLPASFTPTRVGGCFPQGFAFTGPVVACNMNGTSTNLSVFQVATTGTASFVTMAAAGTVQISISWSI